jgi:hypothetical protein
MRSCLGATCACECVRWGGEGVTRRAKTSARVMDGDEGALSRARGGGAGANTHPHAEQSSDRHAPALLASGVDGAATDSTMGVDQLLAPTVTKDGCRVSAPAATAPLQKSMRVGAATAHSSCN